MVDSPLQVLCLLQQRLVDAGRCLDHEVFPGLRGLELVDEDALADTGQRAVDVALPQVGREGRTQVLPQRVQVDQRTDLGLRLIAVRDLDHLERVLLQQTRCVHPDGALADGLDLDPRALLVVQLPVAVAAEVVALGVDRHLQVDDLVPGGMTLRDVRVAVARDGQPTRALSRGRPEKDVAADLTLPPAVQHAKASDPALPLGVDVVALLEDGLQSR
jgi:hypothetical protein